VVEPSKTSTHVEIHGITAAELFLDRFYDIISYARARMSIEQEFKKINQLVEQAEELAKAYDNPRILEETLREIEQYLEQPRIVG